jgi:branched-subunit amino acid aminotransferase/4-amino-4-deoxychorismate lyase
VRIPSDESPAWADGHRVRPEQLAIPASDPAFQFGLGLFETLALRGGALLDFELHLARLGAACRRLDVPVPHDDLLRRVALEAATGQSAACGWLKIICTRGGRWFVFSGEMDPAEEGRVISAVTLPWRRNPDDPLTGLKTLNYAGSALGLEQARRREADEGIWLNTRGHLAEGCTSNLFVVDGRKLFTPSVRDGILPGVVRGLVLPAARVLGFLVHEGKLRPPRLGRAREAFLTSSLCGVRPLVRVDGRALGGGVPGAATRRIAAEVDKLRERTS